MTRDQLHDFLFAANRSDDELLEALNDFASASDVPTDVSRTILLDVDDEGDSFRFGELVRLRTIELLRRDDIASLETVLDHLALTPFVDEPEAVKEVYLREVNDAIGPLVRPFNCAGPDELATFFAKHYLGTEPELEQTLDVKLLHRILCLCDLVMGGGFFPFLRQPETLADVVDILERNL